MQEFAKAFYKSRAWQRTRDAYAASVGGFTGRRRPIRRELERGAGPTGAFPYGGKATGWLRRIGREVTGWRPG